MFTPTNTPKPRRRRHGYRGYGSPFHEASRRVIHWGRGFSGVEFLNSESSLLPQTADLLPSTRKPA